MGQQEDKTPGQEMGITDVETRGVLLRPWPRPRLVSHPGKARLQLVPGQRLLQGLGQTTAPLWARSSSNTVGLAYHLTVLKRETMPPTFSSGHRERRGGTLGQPPKHLPITQSALYIHGFNQLIPIRMQRTDCATLFYKWDESIHRLW